MLLLQIFKRLRDCVGVCVRESVCECVVCEGVWYVYVCGCMSFYDVT